MERRDMIQKTLGLGALATLALAQTGRLQAQTGGGEGTSSRVNPNGITVKDAHKDLTARMATLAARGGGTLELGDGTYEIDETLVLPLAVSLVMTPHAVIKAKADFKGDTVLVKGGGKYPRGSNSVGWIRGGVIDGNRQALTGIRVDKCHRLDIADLEVQDCTVKGFHLAKGGNETNLSRVRATLTVDLHHAPGSVGIHYERGDSKVSQAHLIGYETGIKDDWGSNWFHMVHVWNTEPSQGPLKIAFDCNGGNDAFHMCYADSPVVAGFYIKKPSHTVMQCSVLYSRWAADGEGAGILITPEGKHGTYMANDIYAEKEHRLGKAFAGDLSSACILGNRYTNVVSGLENRIPSGEAIPTESKKIQSPVTYPALEVGGTGLRLNKNLNRPADAEGQPGEMRWVEDGAENTLWVKTSAGWKSARLQ